MKKTLLLIFGFILSFGAAAQGTGCTVTSFPYSETFDNWNAACWVQTGNTFTTYETWEARQGGCLGFTDNQGDYMLVLPEMEAPLNELTLTFWMKDNGWSVGSIQVGYCTDPTNTSSFTSLLTVRPPRWESHWDEYTVDFGNLPDNAQGRIAFRHAAGDYASFYLDDLSVTRATSCGNAINLRVPTTGETAAGVRWDNDAGETSGDYWLQYKIVASQQWDSLNASENYTFLTNLVPDTTYMVRIKSLCMGEGQYGAPVYFSTQGCGSALVGQVDSLDLIARSEDIPLRTYANHSYSQQIYPASQLGRLTDTIYGIAFFNLEDIWQEIDRNITIRLGLTEKERFEDEGEYIEEALLQQVYSGTHRFSHYGWHTILFDQPFLYDNRYNLVVAVNDHTGQGTGFWTPRFATTLLGSAVYCNSTTSISAANLSAQGFATSERVAVARFLGPCRQSSGCGNPLVMEVGGDPYSIDFAILPGGNEAGWDIYLRPLGESDWELNTYASQNLFSFGGLEPGSTYDFLFQPDCAQDGVFATTVRSTTMCGAVSLPYRQNFDLFPEGTRNLPCWTRQGYSQVVQHSDLGRVLALHGGDRVVLPLVDWNDPSQLNLRLLLQPSAPTQRLLVGLMEEPSDPTTYEPIDTITFSDTAARYHSIDFSRAEGYGLHVVLTLESGSLDEGLLMDNLLLRLTPDCDRPDSLQATATGANSAQLSFLSQAPSQLVEWGEAGFELGSGTFAPIASSPASLQGLPSGTEIDLYLYNVCSNGDTSLEAGPVRITTQCGAITRPYRMGFEGIGMGQSDSTGVLPLCWSNALGNSEVYRDYTTAHRGTGCLALRPGGTVVLPPLADTIDPRMSFLDFWAHCWEGANIAIGFCSDASGSDFTLVETAHVQDYVYSHIQRYLVTYQGTGRCLALRNLDTAVVYIDDLLLDNAPSCLPVSGLHQVGVGATSVTLDWTPLGDESQWEIFATTTGAPPSQGTLTSSHPFTLDNLNAGEEVLVYVRAVCGQDDTGRWTGPLSVAANTWVMRPNQSDEIYLCGGTVYDDGGPQGNYSDNQSSSLILHADTTFGPAYLDLHLTGHIESSSFYSSDFLRLYDGTSTSGNLLFDSDMQEGVLDLSVTAYSGSLYLTFSSDPFQNYAGFALEVSCEPVTCPMVSNLQASYSDGTITASWTPEGNEQMWEVSCGHQRQVVTTTSYSFSNLLSSYCYPVSVRPICGEGDTGRAQTVYLSTPCGPYRLTHNTPFFESFETTQMPVNDCWNVVYQGNTPTHSIERALHGQRSFRFSSLDGSVDPLDQYLVTPEIDCDDQMTLSFHYCRSHDSEERLAVGYSPSSQNPSDPSWVWVDTLSCFNSWSRYCGQIPAEAVYIGVRLLKESDGYYVYLDSLLLTTLSNGCGAPTLGAVSDLSFNQATLHWSGRNGATYQLQLRPSSSNSWATAEEQVLQGEEWECRDLLAGTTYLYRLRTLCSDELQSAWVEGSFVTDSLPCHAPASLELTDLGGTSASFAWNAGEHHTEWQLRVWNTVFDTLMTVSAPEATLEGLFGSTRYQAAVRALCEHGAALSDWSDTLSLETLTCLDPSDLHVVALTETTATLAWTEHGPATQWRLNYGPAGHTTDEGTEITVDENPFTLTGLQSGHTYDFILQSVCAPGWYSQQVTSAPFTTEGVNGIGDLDAALDFVLYPNPASDHIVVETSLAPIDLQIVDLQGRIVLHKTLNSQLSTLHLQALASGTYFIKCGSAVRKLIIK